MHRLKNLIDDVTKRELRHHEDVAAEHDFLSDFQMINLYFYEVNTICFNKSPNFEFSEQNHSSLTFFYYMFM